MVETEIELLQAQWTGVDSDEDRLLLDDLLGEAVENLDPFDRVQLAYTIRICRKNRSLSAAGRFLFSASRRGKASQNDADRLKKYLQRHNLNWEKVTEEENPRFS